MSYQSSIGNRRFLRYLAIALRSGGLLLGNALFRLTDLLRPIGQFPSLNKPAGLNHQAEEVIVVDIHEDGINL